MLVHLNAFQPHDFIPYSLSIPLMYFIHDQCEVPSHIIATQSLNNIIHLHLNTHRGNFMK